MYFEKNFSRHQWQWAACWNLMNFKTFQRVILTCSSTWIIDMGYGSASYVCFDSDRPELIFSGPRVADLSIHSKVLWKLFEIVNVLLCWPWTWRFLTLFSCLSCRLFCGIGAVVSYDIIRNTFFWYCSKICFGKNFTRTCLHVISDATFI